MEACGLLLIKHVWRRALPLKPLFGYGDSSLFLLWMSQQFCGHYLGPTRYCPNINLHFQDLGYKQTQQFGCLVLDRYFEYSARSSTRVARASKKTPTRVHKLGEKKTLPSRDVILKCVANKIKINHLICKLIMNDQELLYEATSH